MKKSTLLLLAALFTVPLCTDANAQFVKAGAGLMYGSEIEQVGLRGDAVYQINDEFRIVGDLGFYFPDKTDFGGGDEMTVRWWELNGNVNYIFYSDEEQNLMAYGLGGLNFLNISVKSDIGGSTSTNSDSEVGLNLGAGIEYGLDFADLFGELKFVVGDADQLNLGAGLRFPF